MHEIARKYDDYFLVDVRNLEPLSLLDLYTRLDRKAAFVIL